MHRFNKIIIVAALCMTALPAFAVTATTTSATSTATTTAPVPTSFCDRVDTVTEAVHSDASQRTAEHRADVQRIDSQREDDKKKLNEVRKEDRAQEDAAREALVIFLREHAVTPEALLAVDSFATNSARYIHDLRVASDKAREVYSKVTRPVTLGQRAKRDKALSLYIDKLDAANRLAEGECAKGTKDVRVLEQYVAWLKDANTSLSTSLNEKKSTLEQRARDAHFAELARLQKTYERNIQREMSILTDKFPELFPAVEDTATTTPEIATDTPQSI